MIQIRLQLFLIVISLTFLIYIFSLVRKEKLELKYTLAWCLMGFVLVLIAVQPQIVEIIAELLGIGLPVNAVFLLGIFCILIILLTLTVAISRTSIRTKRLIQELAILKFEINENKSLHQIEQCAKEENEGKI
ncbi:MAG: DUF2304 domain-containing protein [Methanocorpusculum sp.]|nr:DUF2304 domain-containing protein [Methanocorpusculum sp.]